MFKFIKDRFSKEREEKPRTVSISDVPVLLEARDAEITADLSAGIERHRDGVLAAREDLVDLIRDLRSKEREEAYHPKLEKIAKNTLPLFEKSMLSSLAKALPSNPEEFYVAASECLKGCVKGLAGPGRYLRGVFPEEMKEIRLNVDRIGREVNAMTPQIADARRKRDEIADLHRTAASLSATIANHNATERDLINIRDKIDEEEQAIEDLKKTLAISEGPAVSAEVDDLRSAVSDLQGELSSADRSLRADISVIAHVLRKGERILQRGEGASASREIEAVVDALDGSNLPDEDQLLSGLNKVLPIIRSMIASGEIVLKNKEERELFSEEVDITARIKSLYDQYRGAESRLSAAERDHEAHPIVEKIRWVQHERETREARLADLRDKMAAIGEREQSLSREIPALLAAIEQGISRIEGKPVMLVSDEHA
jgi:predicted  nucleic acid-binding Zn-ribbon protein